jgi:mono/diheme cytochrome c family protein
MRSGFRVWGLGHRGSAARALGIVTAALVLAGCHADMYIQPKMHKPFQQSDFFADGQSSRPPVPGTVARGQAKLDTAYYTGIISGSRTPIGIGGGQPVDTGIFRGKYVNALPFRMTRDDLKRGQQQFNVYCAPCHGLTGRGDGMITQRGLVLRRKPTNYHSDKLRKIPIGHFYDVITNGFGIMFSYASRIQDPADRWRIAAYIRVLQASQNATEADVPAGTNLDAPAASTTGSGASH